MALSHAILVSLLDRPQTGYELGKRFDNTVGYFWKVSHQQIYQELHRMAKAGWLSSSTVEQADRPNRIVYTLTECGREVLKDWGAQPTEAPSVKEELLVKLFALGDLEPEVLAGELESRLAYHRDRLGWYEAVMVEHYPEPAKLTLRRRGRYLGLRMGILSERATVAWCEEALAELRAEATAK